jgi:hypothetical protein
MILKTTWITVELDSHPELNGYTNDQRLLALRFLDEKSIEAIQEKALRMRSRSMFDEPYEPPEYLQ